MDKNVHLPSIPRIVWTDYTAFFMALSPVVVWIVYLAWVPQWRQSDPIIPTQGAWFFLYFAVVVTLIGLAVLAWRVRLFKTVFQEGLEIHGRISSFSMARDRGQVKYTYACQGKRYESGVTLHRTKQTRKLKVGDRVVLVVDRSNPGRAFIRDLYN